MIKDDRQKKKKKNAETTGASLEEGHGTATNHYENKPIQIYWKFYHQKMKIFR